jgi:hypothetical protein
VEEETVADEEGFGGLWVSTTSFPPPPHAKIPREKTNAALCMGAMVF